MKKRGGVDSGRETDNSGNLSEGGQVDIRVRKKYFRLNISHSSIICDCSATDKAVGGDSGLQ